MDRKDDVNADAEAGQGHLAKLISDAEKKLARETAELNVKRKMVAALPAGLVLQPKVLHGSGYKCDGGLTFAMTERQQAVELLAQLPPAASVLLRERGGCTTFMPIERFDGKVNNNQTVTDVDGVTFRCEGYGGGYTSESFHWWTQLDDQLIHIKVEHPRTAAGGVRISAWHARDPRGNITQRRWSFDGVPQGQVIDWYTSTDTDPGAITVHWPAGGDTSIQMLSRGLHNRIG